MKARVYWIRDPKFEFRALSFRRRMVPDRAGTDRFFCWEFREMVVFNLVFSFGKMSFFETLGHGV